MLDFPTECMLRHGTHLRVRQRLEAHSEPGAGNVRIEALILPGRVILRGVEGRREADAIRLAVEKFGLEATVESISPCG